MGVFTFGDPIYALICRTSLLFYIHRIFVNLIHSRRMYVRFFGIIDATAIRLETGRRQSHTAVVVGNNVLGVRIYDGYV